MIYRCSNSMASSFTEFQRGKRSPIGDARAPVPSGTDVNDFLCANLRIGSGQILTKDLCRDAQFHL